MDLLPPPLSVFGWEDPTLDPNAIAHSEQPAGKGLPMALSGALVLAIGGGLCCLPEEVWIRQAGYLAAPSWVAKRDVSVLLAPESVPPALQHPAPDKRPFGTPGGDAGGGGGGNGMRPPETGLEDVSGRTFAESDAGLEVLALRAPSNPTLPIDPAGDGRSLGRGPGSGGGTGGGTGGGSGSGRGHVPPDFKIVSIRQTILRYNLKPWELAKAGIIAVEVMVEMDGHVSQARMVSGPDFVREVAEMSALRWLFEPLAPHGLRSPTKVTIRFHYDV